MACLSVCLAARAFFFFKMRHYRQRFLGVYWLRGKSVSEMRVRGQTHGVLCARYAYYSYVALFCGLLNSKVDAIGVCVGLRLGARACLAPSTIDAGSCASFLLVCLFFFSMLLRPVHLVFLLGEVGDDMGRDGGWDGTG